MITQFAGETRQEAIVNHYSLDIEEEDSFFEYLMKSLVPLDASDEEIEGHYRKWASQ